MDVDHVVSALVSDESSDDSAEVLSVLVILIVEKGLVLCHFVHILVHDGSTAVLESLDQAFVVEYEINSRDIGPLVVLETCTIYLGDLSFLALLILLPLHNIVVQVIKMIDDMLLELHAP